MTEIKLPKKLIEVRLPLVDINAACAYEKMPGIGPHPRGIHLWWARRPLAAARAIIFAQMVNDPGYQHNLGFVVSKKDTETKRDDLVEIISDLVKWENTNNEEVLNRARAAIWESWRETCDLNSNHPQAVELFNPEKLPAFHDPFAGGGAIPLEAQRLGLESYASDLNPVAVMINKAMIEIPHKFADCTPVGPIPADEKQIPTICEWLGISGLAEDVRRYGHWMYKEAFRRIGHLYPKMKITSEMVAQQPDKVYENQELPVIAWLWARTVKSPNPAFSHVDVPLVRSFVVSNKKGKAVWVEPVIRGDSYRFEIRMGKKPAEALDGTMTRTGGTCILSRATIPFKYIRNEGKAGRIGQKLMAIVVKGKKGRVYLSPTDEMESIALESDPQGVPDTDLPEKALGFRVQEYGMLKHRDLFTSRQLVALTTFFDLIEEAREQAIVDAMAIGMVDDGLGIDQGGTGATAYGDALTVFLAFCVNRCVNFNNSLTVWAERSEKITYLFVRQAISMVWDFGEANIMENVVGGFTTNLEYQVKCLLKLGTKGCGIALQRDASTQSISSLKVISTDPPYYDNIGFADLSDFFYVWMRRSLRSIYPELFGTMTVPKAEELIAAPHRHGSKEKAETFFMDGMTQAMHNLSEQAHPAFPVTIYYAFKQSETKEGSTISAGWVTFLEAVMRAGFLIDGTWPVRSEQTYRVRGLSSNALASSIVLVCRKRLTISEPISAHQFQRKLRKEMPEALAAMIGDETGQTSLAPVDLAQAAIGPGMAIFSQYDAVLKQDGSKMDVRDALILINHEITEYLNPESGDFDADTLFCNDWFGQHRWAPGAFGDAELLARAKGTSVDGVRDAGVIESGGGKVRLLKWSEYPSGWDSRKDNRTPVWEACHHMIRALNQQSESAAGALLARMPEQRETIRQLAYYLYTICERKKHAEDARDYNELIIAWPAIVAASRGVGYKEEKISLPGIER